MRDVELSLISATMPMATKSDRRRHSVDEG